MTPEDHTFCDQVRQSCLAADRGHGPEPDAATLRRFFDLILTERAAVMAAAAPKTAKRRAKKGATVEGMQLPGVAE